VVSIRHSSYNRYFTSSVISQIDSLD